MGPLVGAPGPIDPGETGSFTVTLDASNPNSRYFNFASMILPSNDFFIANGNERAHEIFDAKSNFLGADFTVIGSQVLDAGTEVNDEIPANTAFFGQSVPNTGTVENGVVRTATGFIPGGSILIEGGNGKDRLYGNEGNDTLSGGNGDDTLFGGNGFNRLTGGAGSDVFSLSTGTGFDTITDFNLGSGDLIGLSNGLNFGDLTISGVGRNTVISFGNDELAILRNVSAASITGAAFA